MRENPCLRNHREGNQDYFNTKRRVSVAKIPVSAISTVVSENRRLVAASSLWEDFLRSEVSPSSVSRESAVEKCINESKSPFQKRSLSRGRPSTHFTSSSPNCLTSSSVKTGLSGETLGRVPLFKSTPHRAPQLVEGLSGFPAGLSLVSFLQTGTDSTLVAPQELQRKTLHLGVALSISATSCNV